MKMLYSTCTEDPALLHHWLRKPHSLSTVYMKRLFIVHILTHFVHVYRCTLSTVVFTTGRTSAEHRYNIDCTALALMWTDDIELYGDMNI